MLGFGKWKTEEWSGEVERKSYAKKFCDQFEVGGRIEKRPGEKKPVKA